MGNPGFKGRAFLRSGFSAEGTSAFASTVTHCRGNVGGRWGGEGGGGARAQSAVTCSFAPQGREGGDGKVPSALSCCCADRVFVER